MRTFWIIQDCHFLLESTTVADAVRVAIYAAHACGITLLDNVAFIIEELPNVSLTPRRRAEIETFCSNAAKHEMLGEIFEAEELLDAPVPDTVLIRSRVKKVIGWLTDDIMKIHELGRALNAGKKRDPEYELGWTLVICTATDALLAFNRLQTAYNAITDDSSGNK